MLVFLASEAMLFAGLIGGYIVLRIAQGPGAWPPPGAPEIGVKLPPTFLNLVMITNTVILLASSVTYHWGEVRMRKGGSGLIGYGLTALFGTIFLGVQAWEWMHLKHEGMWFNSYGIYGSCFFTMTGFHGLHVFLGLLGILMAVSGLGFSGILNHVANQLTIWMHGSSIAITSSIGVLSAIIDNVPLVAAAQGMYPIGQLDYAPNGLFWELLAFTSGTGGSLLIIGSAAGVAAMGMEKVSFGWYLKKISLPAFIGYGIGILSFWILS
jgi:heme/copper-type cytochrome/quinol oxidase subunit 3